MTQFFHGWRRKIGVMTLVIAMGLSRVVGAQLAIHTEILNWRTHDGLDRSGPHLEYFGWVKITPRSDSNRKPLEGISTHCAHHQSHNQYWKKWQIFEWRVGLGEFDFGAGTGIAPGTEFRIERWAIPYWSLVIPLALLSTYLLLSKPRVAKPKSEST